MAWNVDCVRCEKSITAENPSEIRRDCNDDPICDSCPYADEPDYPVTCQVTVRPSKRTVMSSVGRAIQKYQPYIEDEDYEALPPSLTSFGGQIAVDYEIDVHNSPIHSSEEFSVTPVSLNGTKLVSALEKQVYQCQGCGIKIEAYAVTEHETVNDHYPLVHKQCESSRMEKFEPISDNEDEA